MRSKREAINRGLLVAIATVALILLATSLGRAQLMLLGVGGGSNVFPSVQTTATSNTCNAVSSCAVTLPSGITAGDLLVVCGTFGDGRGVTLPAGWTAKLWDANNTTGANGWCFYKLPASGSEGASVTVTNGGTTSWATAAYRISPASAITAATNVLTVDPPSFTPAGGAKNYLWIAQADGRFSSAPTWTAPGSYVNLIQANNALGNSATVVLSARQLNAATENPATYTNTGTVTFPLAQTMAVAP